jgi:hypothetical protein
MSKPTNRLLIVALLSAFAAASTGSAVAAQKHDGKEQSRQSKKEQHDKGKSGRDREERHDKDRSGHDSDAPKMTAKTSVVTVTNRGASPLTITAPPAITRLSGNGTFAIVPPGTGTPCATSVVVTPRGGNCTIGVEYTPTDDEESTARLVLTDTGAATATQETVIKSD